MRSQALLVVVLGLIWGGDGIGQNVTDITLPAAMPPGFEGPTFARSSSVAVATRDEIFVWTGLPTQSIHQVIGLPPAQRMATPWKRLDARSAQYVSVGADLTPDTNDDELIIVLGLPEAPLLVPTGYLVRSAQLTLVNESTAVLGTPTGFLVVRFDAQGVTLTPVPFVHGVASDEMYEVGAANGNTALALSPGPDSAAGTTDDLLLALRGLDPANTGGFTVSVSPLPPVAGPRGFVVSERGVGVAWRPLTLPTFELVLAKVHGGHLDYTTILVTTPANYISPSYTPPHGVRTNPGGGVVVWNHDELGPGDGLALVADLDLAPTVAGTWYDDWNSGGDSEIMSERDVVRTYAAGGNGFEFTRFGPSTTSTMVTQEPMQWNNPHFVRPNAGSVAAFANQIQGFPNTEFFATVTLAQDVFQSSIVTTLSRPGSWTGDIHALWGYNGPRVFAMGAGRVAGFLRSSFQGQRPDVLRIVDVATASIETTAHRLMPSELQLQLSPGIPSARGEIRVSLPATPGWSGDLFVAFAAERGPALDAAFVYGCIHLDLSSLVALIPLSSGGNGGELVFGAQSLPPALWGMPLYIQGLRIDEQVSLVSDLGLLVIGGSGSGS